MPHLAKNWLPSVASYTVLEFAGISITVTIQRLALFMKKHQFLLKTIMHHSY